ncbi:hypothetical protein AB0G35_13605 [Streptomyces sp. NPDC021749]|uniref:hypothetical protein n=1 Tax=Streptomyces sp. NPDC021749 TaxID=3154905 RepID=UPI0033D641EA
MPLLTGTEGWLLWKPTGGTAAGAKAEGSTKDEAVGVEPEVRAEDEAAGVEPEAGAGAAAAGGKVRDTAGSGSPGKVRADFVADEGWQLPGRIPGAEADRIAAARPYAPFPLDAGRRTRLLELSSHWPRTVPVGVLLGMILSVAAAGALLLPVDGGWRVWTALAGALAPLVLWMTTGRVTPPSEQPATGRAAHSGGGTGDGDRPSHLTR